MNNKKWIPGLMILCSAILFLSACKKDHDNKPVPPAENLQVKFTNATIGINWVDSAMVIFKKEGSATLIMKRFDKQNNVLTVTVDDLPAGNWTANLYVYAHDAESQIPFEGFRYLQEKTFTLPYTKEQVISVDGPDGKFASPWKSHIVLTDLARSVVLTVPLDCADPYFEFIINDPQYDYLYLDRIAFQRNGSTNAIVASANWECGNNCYGPDRFIANKTAFLPFTQALQGKAWDNGDVTAVVMNQQIGRELLLFYHYDKK